MSSNTVFTYQHTCRKGQSAYILKKAPFKAPVKKTPEGTFKIPFLGEGYYLWEENNKAAVDWGKKHYAGNFNVVEFEDLKIPNEELLDFMNRRNMNYFNDLREDYIKKRPKSRNWPIGAWIEFFKKLRKGNFHLFPFYYIRADENLPNDKENNRIKGKEFFAENVYYYTFTNPLLILCVLDKNKIECNSKTIKV
ncbi:hypothetical protein [Planktosalinus lacus]|uniref:Uncharacterized protein n=1 Tax=Planktosalinus lacus TaxID=1526573 RepID=A0A8J2Y9J4_9FLAO|nr:hypothetical protein [Planktosalinus lacus]GGD99027.1 hypothetical protein GCM10011312_23130 [Planktosalinus lacus]